MFTIQFWLGIIIGGILGSFLGLLAYCIVSVYKLKGYHSKISKLNNMNTQLELDVENLQLALNGMDQDHARQAEKMAIMYGVIEELDAEELVYSRLNNPDA